MHIVETVSDSGPSCCYLGIAPLHAADYNTTDQNDLEKECTTGRCMGPIGLDFGLENVPQEQQIHAFEEQVTTQKCFSSLHLLVWVCGAF